MRAQRNDTEPTRRNRWEEKRQSVIETPRRRSSGVACDGCVQKKEGGSADFAEPPSVRPLVRDRWGYVSSLSMIVSVAGPTV